MLGRSSAHPIPIVRSPVHLPIHALTKPLLCGVSILRCVRRQAKPTFQGWGAKREEVALQSTRVQAVTNKASPRRCSTGRVLLYVLQYRDAPDLMRRYRLTHVTVKEHAVVLVANGNQNPGSGYSVVFLLWPSAPSLRTKAERGTGGSRRETGYFGEGDFKTFGYAALLIEPKLSR